MKKLLALIVLLLGFTDTQAQNFTYRPLKEFHGDTIAFLKSNFYDQRSYYAFGKSLPDKVTPYGIASLLKDFVIKDIRIDVYDRRRSH